MENQAVIFIYKEIFNQGITPFVKTCKDESTNSFLTKSFVEFGGLSILDVKISDNEHWRISYWTSPQGYKNWLLNPMLKSFLEQRKIYNQSFEIKTELLGPFDANEILKIESVLNGYHLKSI